MEPILITDCISYWKATENPLSADVGIIRGESSNWIFDVGNSEKAAADINALPGPKNIVLSHFHPDHSGNLGRISYDHLYQGAHTNKYTKAGGTFVKEDIFIRDGVRLHLFPLPSSHAKGSVGLEVNERYAFLGDGIYSTMKGGKAVYNAGLLLEQLKVLRSLKAQYFLLSHDENFVHDREEVLGQLEQIYRQRDPKSSYIFLGMDKEKKNE